MKCMIYHTLLMGLFNKDVCVIENEYLIKMRLTLENR